MKVLVLNWNNCTCTSYFPGYNEHLRTFLETLSIELKESITFEWNGIEYTLLIMFQANMIVIIKFH